MKLSNYLSLAIVMVAVAFTATAHADKLVGWEIDKAHTTIGFKVRHLGISNVEGKFTDYSADIKADPKTGKLGYVKAEVKVASIDTGVEGRDNHLRGADFFDAEKFDVMTLLAKDFKWDGNKFSGTADMTIKGRKRPVKFEGEYLGAHKVDFGNGPQMRAGYEVTATINRKTFGLSFNKLAEGVSVVGDEVTITLNVEIMRNLEKK